VSLVLQGGGLVPSAKLTNMPSLYESTGDQKLDAMI
jgi:hypothetical protein